MTGIPDPRYSNPELFDLSKPDAPIPQFVHALNKAGIEISSEQVLQGLTYNARGNAVFIVYNIPDEDFPPGYRELGGEYPLMMLSEGRGWKEVSPRDLSEMNDFPVGILWGGFIIRDPNYFGEQIVKAPNYFSFIRESMLDLQTPIENGRFDLRRNRNQFNFYIPDLTFNYAKRNGMPIVFGHVFGGDADVNIPDWVKNINDRGDFLNFMLEHLTTIVTRYSTDEIPVQIILFNEYFGNPFQNTVASRFWKTKANSLGISDEELMRIMFNRAKEVGPHTRFIFNEYAMEIPGSYNYAPSKDDEIFSLLQSCKRIGVPIDGVGFQMHLYAKDFYGNRSFQTMMKNFRRQIQKYQTLGLEIHVTELDVRIDDMPSVPLEERLLLQAKIYQSIIRVAKAEGIKTVTIWGTADWESWLNNPDLTGPDSKESRPLFLDKNNQRKLSYYGIIRGLYDQYI